MTVPPASAQHFASPRSLRWPRPALMEPEEPEPGMGSGGRGAGGATSLCPSTAPATNSAEHLGGKRRETRRGGRGRWGRQQNAAWNYPEESGSFPFPFTGGIGLVCQAGLGIALLCFAHFCPRPSSLQPSKQPALIGRLEWVGRGLISGK